MPWGACADRPIEISQTRVAALTNYTAQVDNIFDSLSNVPDLVMPGLGCKKKPCPDKPKESGAKGPDESAPVTKLSDTAKPTESNDASKNTGSVASTDKASSAASSTGGATTSKPSDNASAGMSKSSATAASTTGPTASASTARSASASGSGASASSVVPTTTQTPTVETASGSCSLEDTLYATTSVDKRAAPSW